MIVTRKHPPIHLCTHKKSQGTGGAVFHIGLNSLYSLSEGLGASLPFESEMRHPICLAWGTLGLCRTLDIVEIEAELT